MSNLSIVINRLDKPAYLDLKTNHITVYAWKKAHDILKQIIF